MRLSKLSFFILSSFCLVSLAGCMSSGTKAEVTSGHGSQSINEAQMEAYDGPKARIAVSRFTNKSAGSGGGGGWYSSAIGDGMADQMTTALFNTNRYIVLERQTLKDVISEQDLGASGRVKQGTEAQIGEIEGAELLIVGAITEFSNNASGGGGALGGVIGSFFGGVSGGMKKAHMAIDVRVIDAKTSRILAATSVEGEATDVKLGGGIAGGALSMGLGGWKNTPMEKALRICINKAVDFIASKTPQRYYRHGQGVSTPAAVTSPSTTSPSTARIKRLQTYLSNLGYDVGTPDGQPGAKTRQAIMDFQWDYKLKETGEFDPATIEKLREVIKK
ncbi:MAG: hypothetical protein GY699_09355 [Desulfobacteraceae bacterium]|nr:hypothetical protein [Desulfobacteraceae bacterium]